MYMLQTSIMPELITYSSFEYRNMECRNSDGSTFYNCDVLIVKESLNDLSYISKSINKSILLKKKFFYKDKLPSTPYLQNQSPEVIPLIL